MNTGTKVVAGLTAGALITGAAAAIGVAVLGNRALRQWQHRRSDTLRGKTVLITGGSRGLGLALAEEFARQGCNIVICARSDEELQRAARMVESLGAEVQPLTCDLTKPDEVEQMINLARDRFERVDILVNNAGTISVGPLLSQTFEDFQEAMNLMFWGAVYPTLALLPEMITRGDGRIVNITSIGGKVRLPHLLAFRLLKFAR